MRKRGNLSKELSKNNRPLSFYKLAALLLKVNILYLAFFTLYNDLPGKREMEFWLFEYNFWFIFFLIHVNDTVFFYILFYIVHVFKNFILKKFGRNILYFITSQVTVQ